VSSPTVTNPGTGRRGSGAGRVRVALRVAGAGLLVATGSIHLDLYLTGYSTIPTIDWLFLLQVISAFGLALATLVVGGRLIAASGAGFVVSTLAGYELALRVGLFGFREVRTTAGTVAGIIEVTAFIVLATLALSPLEQLAPGATTPSSLNVAIRSRGAAPMSRWLAGVVAVLLGVSLALSIAATAPKSTSAGPSGALLKIATIHGVAVLTNGRGYTLYWFSRDTSSSSACTGPCSAYWPPVIGARTGGAGVSGSLGTINRSDGKTQATYDHHPLYTYVGDSGPHQSNGNGIRLSGGLWHEMMASR